MRIFPLSALALVICAYAQGQVVPTYYITPSQNGGVPIMPDLRFNLGNYNALGSPNFVFSIKSEHSKRRDKDNFSISSPSVTGVWNVNSRIPQKVFGGEGTLKPSKAEQASAKIRIRGKNPDPETAMKYIRSNCGEHWYAYAIARHESRQRYYVFNQFNSSYYKASIYGIPNCGLPDGWGIMQIDSARGSQITTDEVYNWQTNVRSGIKVMDKAT